MLVRPSVRLGAEGPRDAKSCRGTRVTTSSYMRPIAADAQSRLSLSVHPRGLLLQTRSSGVVGPYMRPIVTDAQQWRGLSIYGYATYCCWGSGRTTGWPTYRLCLAFLISNAISRRPTPVHPSLLHFTIVRVIKCLYVCACMYACMWTTVSQTVAIKGHVAQS